jgi:hypothetical protein
MTTTRIKVRLTNTFHGSEVNVIGELVELGRRYETETPAGHALVRVSDAQQRRAERALCGIKGCRCGNLGPTFYHGTVVGEVV